MSTISLRTPASAPTRPQLPPLPALVAGQVTHRRPGPVRHSFRHRVYQWLVDLDCLPRQPWHLRAFAHFSSADHLGDPALPIKRNIENYLALGGIGLGDRGRVLMLASARVLGHVFDPLSVFWCYDSSGRLVCVVAEVHNTYGERHAYLLRPDEAGTAVTDKSFYVSPFFDVTGTYELRFTLRPDLVATTVTLRREGTVAFSATFRGRPEPATSRNLVRRLIRQPLMTQRVSALIRVHGIWLWLRRPARPRSAAPHPAGRNLTMTVSTAIRWPAAATTPRAPLRAGIARVIFDHAVRRVPVRVTYPDGRVLGAGSPASPELEVVRPAAFLARLGRDAKIGFGEAYMAGDWRAGSGTDLADLLTSFASRLTVLIPPALQRLRVFVDRPVPHDQENTLDGSRSNIAAHYDLSNDLFAAFLDPTMTYSSAWFDDSEPVETATRLEEAQLRKVDGILDLAGVRSGTRLLEIGTGWGTLAIRAAQRGARVTTITLSREQMRLARERVESAGLSGLVEVRVQDYREAGGLYDAIVSVEMIEAVGEAYWPAYFAALDRLLAPGGTVAIQAITMDHQRFLATRRSFSWIQKYIFPGGIIPSLQAVDDTLAAHTTLRVTHRRELRTHYARTLRLWRERFLGQWPRIHAQGFDETFRRMWEFYLAYSEAGFRSGYLGVSQLQMTREPAWS